MLMNPNLCAYNDQYFRTTAMLGGVIVAMTPLKNALGDGRLLGPLHLALGGMAGEAFCQWRATGSVLRIEAGNYASAAVYGFAAGSFAQGQNPVKAVTDVAMDVKQATIG